MPVRFFRGEHLVLETETEPQLNLLAHAQLEELDVGSQCGGHGRCGKDRIQLDAGALPVDSLSPLTDPEKRHLSDAEIRAGFRLACQCWPNSRDLVINVRI